MSKIKEFGLSRLWVEEDFGFQQLVYKELPKMGYETGDEEDEPGQPSVQSVAAGTFKAGVDAKVAAFVAAFEKFDEALKDSEKLASSALVTKADDARDYAWRGVSNYLKAMTMHPDADVAAAAVEGEELVDKYGDPTNLSYTAESGTLHNFLQDLEAIPSEKRTLLGIDPWTARLRKENDAFLLAIQQKAEEKDAREVGVVKEVRQEADEAYRAMVDTINVVANLEEGTTYDAFIGAVNQHIETQKTTLKSRATRNKNKKDEKPEEEEPDDRPVVQ